MHSPSRPAKRPSRRAAIITLGVLLLAVIVLGLTPLAAAAPSGQSPAVSTASGGDAVDFAALAGRGTVVQFGKDATVEADEEADAVVAIGGDVRVEGTVQVAVAVGGDVTVVGTVEKTCVSVGGNVRLTDTAVVGSELNDKGDAAVVLVGGRLIRAPEAQIEGSTTTVQGKWFADAVRWGVWAR